MSDTLLSQKKTQPVKKICVKCNVSKTLDKFYSNSGWKDQLCRDAWCSDCATKCITKDAVKEYFWQNHRQFNEELWQLAEKKALNALVTNNVYVNATEDRKRTILQRMTAQKVFTLMHIRSYYKYLDTDRNGVPISYADAKKLGLIETKQEDQEEQVYSEQFNGWFSTRDLNYLHNYYNKLNDDFGFDNESMRDYARKVCKASLQADRAQDLFMQGRVDYNIVKDAMTQFDTLSKSANFAACKRKTQNDTGISSWAQAALYLQTHGHPYTRKIEWPQDDVDKTILQFSHIVSALGLDGL